MLNQYYRRIWGTVAFGCLVSTVVLGASSADEYLRLRSEVSDMQQLQIQWDATQTRARTLRQAEQQVDNLLNELQPRSLTDERLPRLRDDVVELVRASGSGLRSIQLTPATTRPWGEENDDARAPGLDRDALPSDYELHTYTLDLRVDGRLSSIRKLMSDLAALRLLMTTEVMSLSLVDEGGGISLTLRASVYGLAEAPVEQHENI